MQTNTLFKFCLLHVGAVGALGIMQVILVRNEKIEGQSGEETSLKLPVSHNQVQICSPVRCLDSQPSAFSVFIQLPGR